ncbi:hypothetical protein BGC07_04610 [Piscirickettsia litoralis]|uniref:Polypeptide-transport-associated ShlB-type domain-containing protein n=2 Tax=Piscirickettsia litoralis TaxID=1891921 RepID=A0ABX3A1H7_9GAMM|nr:hypothetical protein BGC07_04610 [Piscirickettsia litoralis]
MKKISLYDLYRFKNEINLLYYKQGYLLSYAFIPPQRLCKKKCSTPVILKIIEGYISDVKVTDDTGHNQVLINQLSSKITQSIPLKIKTLEENILLMNELPGQTISSTISPDPNTPGGSQLTLQSKFNRHNSYFVVNNRGTEFIGPTQVIFGSSINSISEASLPR